MGIVVSQGNYRGLMSWASNRHKFNIVANSVCFQMICLMSLRHIFLEDACTKIKATKKNLHTEVLNHNILLHS